MPITLNHTIVPAAHNERAARFFATVMGLPYEGPDRHFAPVRVNESLTLDYLSVPEPPGTHLAFDVDPATFDAVLIRLREAAVPYGNDPSTPDNGRTDHPLAARGLYFTDDSGNLYELMPPA
ncbi:catechol 2,3-dioxygenase-like lactoylglutathione lyase family enzyme [Streptomyces sp. V4I23]|uniref:VOC family protein n=1 Tax=Streptomyces sp. V4I23 TaxID=3042282 RepID=UPI0027831CB0|nr:VOC family protein [Streptomyces sp. V4I23]MDQ1009697.1 catechol 2,3-dioxygenase-like lactoylglutathione lyase family enzyme [Streptomyces sp. V4I23]